MYSRLFCIILTDILLIALHSAEASPGGEKALTYLDGTGTLEDATTSSAGKVHVYSELNVRTADYLRGAFNGVTEDIDDISFNPIVNVIIQLYEGGSWLRDLNLTIGSDNGLSDVSPFNNVESPKIWYAADDYIGLSNHVGDDWLAGVTITAYTSPNSVVVNSSEYALTVQYAGRNVLGRLSPQLKAARQFDEDQATYLEFGLTPRVELLSGSAPLEINLPIVVGIGFDDYYGPSVDTTGFVGIGIEGAKSLGFIPSDYGSWEFTIAFHALVREDELVDAEPTVADDGNTIISGAVGISLAY